MKNLTKRQSEILTFISEVISNEGMPPTRKEIALKFGFKSANSAEEHLKALDKKGYIDLHGGTSRGISISKSFLGIPIVCLLYTSPSPRDRTRSRMPSSA